MTRKPWLAAMLTLLMPGLGQIYSGALERGAVILGMWWVTVVAIFAVTVAVPAWIGAWLPYPLLIASLGIVMADAARTARGAPRPFVPESYNRWYVYLALPLFFAPALGIPI